MCQTPLLYRFLLAVGDAPLDTPAGSLVAGRFLVWSDRLWLDTRPDSPTPPLEKIPAAVLPYLRLSQLAQHMPRPYTYLTPEQTGQASPVLLLDMAPVATRVKRSKGPESTGKLEAALLPSLPLAWGQGSPLQQLNWLRQLATLWPALAQEQVAGTLLQLDELRVDGALLRLTTLVADDPGAAPTLADLGRSWQGLVAKAQPPVRAYLAWLVKALGEEQLRGAADLVAELEGAIQTLAQGLLVTVDWAANTDQGPTRDRNEDACYPEDESRQQRLSGQTVAAAAPPLLLVCDGIGGHEQGNVASQTAIKLLQQELEPLTQQPHLAPTVVAQRLKQALILANDAISARNNDEHRSARARMGTTVVLALVHFPYLSIAHIGDSRAYRISPHTCYQITVDDDVASREVQMGYALYSEATQLPSGGALVQALGISASGYLYPMVQHLLLDDATLLLLCSDGLSDYDRVEALAPSLVAPLASGVGPLGPAVAELIQMANRLNGHDNVSVGLMRLTPQPAPLPTLPPGPLAQAHGDERPNVSGLGKKPAVSTAPTRLAVPPAGSPAVSEPVSGAGTVRSHFPWRPFLGGMAVALLALGGLGWAYGRRAQPSVALRPLATDWLSPALAGEPLPGAALAATVDIAVGSFWQSQSSVAGASAAGIARPLQLLPQPGGAPAPGGALVASGSILRVVSRQTAADNVNWARLEVCSIPSGGSLEQGPSETGPGSVAPPPNPELGQQLSPPGREGWVQVGQLYTLTAPLELVTPAQAGRCVP
ncbi:MAG TPA: protein phosphatase 2C domain-containing protein [Nodosilinea sp.]|nr:protein phosphatase 2C domain-containing protein [Nodosilinea sp.]